MKTNIFHTENKLTFNDVINGIIDGRVFRIESVSCGDNYVDIINSFYNLEKFINEIGYNELEEIKITEL